jgi:hypothetical protein
MPNAAVRLTRTCLATALCASFALATGLAQQSPSFDSRAAQTAPAPAVSLATAAASAEIDRQVHADMAFLADDALHGRGSATRDEHIAALFAAAQFQALGLAPGGDNGSFLQKVALPSPRPRTSSSSSPALRTPRAPRPGTPSPSCAAAIPPPAEVVLLTAHLDHLGMLKPDPANPAADLIYNGADDDASGTTAVLALAHAFASGPRPRRTIVFALFGSEEIGGFGNAASSPTRPSRSPPSSPTSSSR